MAASRRSILKLLLSAPAFAVAAAPTDSFSRYAAKIRPLFQAKLPPGSGDWLSQHEEAGQTYREFRALTPHRVVDGYSTLRIVPIGVFTPGQTAVFDSVRDFLQPFLGLKPVVDPVVSADSIPQSAKRVFYANWPKQLLTSHLLDDVLMKRRQARDAAVLGITGHDLWPGQGWNFVFGQASLVNRVGVWSMARNGYADERPAMRKLCMTRTLKTAMHETGHMFGIRHCTAYECGMNGSNNSDERDRQPVEFCPECQPKLWWTSGLDPIARSRALAHVAHRYDLENLAIFFEKQAAALATA